MSVSIRQILEYLASLSPSGLRRDEGHQFGAKDREVHRVMVCWMADIAAIECAADWGSDLIVTHESLFFPYDIVVTGGSPDFMTWKVNNERITRLAKAGVSVIRFHGSMDWFCIHEAFAGQLGLGTARETRDKFETVYDMEPIRYDDLILKVKAAVEMPPLRVTAGDPGRILRRAGLTWGGMGLFVNVGHMQKLVDLGCDVLIGGETDDYGMRFAIDSGVELIETGHSVSENRGIEIFAQALARQFLGLSVKYYENKLPWRIV